MSIESQIAALPDVVGEGSTGHLGSHAVIHAGLKEHTTELANAKSRIRAVEVAGGISPGDISDAQASSLISQEDSLTRQAITSLFQEDPPGSGLYTIMQGEN